MNTNDLPLSRRKFVAASAAAAASGFPPLLHAKSLEGRSDFHPGHYIALKSAQRITSIATSFLESVKGASKRYLWKTLEPTKGEYDFSSIERDLKLLRGKQLVVFLIDKSHGQVCLPEYMGNYKIQVPKGFCPLRWDPFFAERYIALATAIAKRFDGNEAFEGLAMQETALPASSAALAESNYSPSKYKDSLLQILISTKREMKHSQFFWYTNFIPDDDGHILDEMIKELVPHEIVVGGPDILPYRRALKNRNYPLYKKYRNEVPLFCSAQEDSFCHHKNDIRNSGPDEIRGNKGTPNIHPDGILSMQEIYEFAVNKLFVNYIFWNYYLHEDKGQHSFEDAFKVIKENNSFGTIEQ